MIELHYEIIRTLACPGIIISRIALALSEPTPMEDVIVPLTDLMAAGLAEPGVSIAIGSASWGGWRMSACYGVTVSGSKSRPGWKSAPLCGCLPQVKFNQTRGEIA